MPENETDDERKARRRRIQADHERSNGLVPGTAHMRGDHPEGGQDWAGRARMAEARLAAGQPLDDHDRSALQRAGHAETAA